MKKTGINIKNKLSWVFRNRIWLLAMVTLIAFSSCKKFGYDLPDEGSIPDLTPPEAGFSFKASESDYLAISFTNQSFSATDYSWDFGDGNTSTEKNPSNIYAADGTYTISLTATDKLGVNNTATQTITLEAPPEPDVLLPTILEAGFEDNSLPDGTGDGRDSWRSSLGEIMQITSSPVHSGLQAAKFPSDGTRIAYQELIVSRNADYVLSYYYTMKETPGSITVSVLGGALTDLANVASQTIALNVGSDITDANAWVRVDLPFNSGDNSTIAIFISNAGNESRIDDVSLSIPVK